MKIAAILLMSAVLAFTGCNKVDVEKGTPKCVKKEIKDFNKSSQCDDATVEEYSYQGKTVFVFNHGSCGRDFSSRVIDSDCNYLGSLGGFVGNTEINGENFSSATFIKTTWKKSK